MRRLRPFLTVAINRSHFSNNGGDGIKREILSLALKKHSQYGWTDDAIIDSVKELGLNPVSHTIIQRGPVEIVEHFLKLKNDFVISKLVEYKSKDPEILNTEHDVKGKQKELLTLALNSHLDYFQPYRSTWATALALLAAPQQIPHTLELVQSSVDQLCHEAGLETSR